MTCVESEFDRVGRAVFGDLASSLRTKGRIWSTFVARMEMCLCSESGYRSSAEVLNDYLGRKRPWICCYALRNSSDPAEKENDLVVARRQERNGMNWSFEGSHALTTVAATRRNDEVDGWLSDKVMRFTPKPREIACARIRGSISLCSQGPAGRLQVA